MLHKYTNYYEKEYTNKITEYRFTSKSFNLKTNILSQLKLNLDTSLSIDLKGKSRIELKIPKLI
jgi:hypothetical protein